MNKIIFIDKITNERREMKSYNYDLFTQLTRRKELMQKQKDQIFIFVFHFPEIINIPEDIC